MVVILSEAKNPAKTKDCMGFFPFDSLTLAQGQNDIMENMRNYLVRYV